MPQPALNRFLLIIILSQQTASDLAFGNFTQSNNRRLVIFFRHQRLVTLGGNLACTLGGQHDQLKPVVHVLQAIFNGNSCHNFPDCNDQIA